MKKDLYIKVKREPLKELKEIDAILIPMVDGYRIPAGVRYLGKFIVDDSFYLLFERLKS